MTSAAVHIIHNIPQELHPLIPAFLERRMKEVNEMRLALETDDYTTIREIAHKLKGNGAGYGFPLITDIGKEIEMTAAARNHATTHHFINELETLVLELQTALCD